MLRSWCRESTSLGNTVTIVLKTADRRQQALVLLCRGKQEGGEDTGRLLWPAYKSSPQFLHIAEIQPPFDLVVLIS